LRKNLIKALIFILPSFVIIAAFRIFPLIFSFLVSLHDWGIEGPKDFKGFENFVFLFKDIEFWRSLLNTFYYVMGVVPVQLILGLFFAVFLSSRIKGRTFFRTIYYIPIVTSIVAIAVVWKWILNPYRGFANYILSFLSIPPLKWLEEPKSILAILFSKKLPGPSFALFSLMLLGIWQHTGFNIIIYLAGLENIPKTYYDAAKIDGAGPVKQFFSITLPLLGPTTFYLLIVNTIGSYNIFAPIWIMTSPPGGPLGTTRTVMYYFYQQSFEFWNLGYGSAVAIVSFALIVLLTIFQRKVVEKKVFYG